MQTIPLNLVQDNIEDFINCDRKIVLGNFLYDENIPENVIFENLIKRSKELINRKDVYKLGLIDEKELIKGIIIFEKSKWDSEHFGFGIGKSKLTIFDSDVTTVERRSLIRDIKTESHENLKLIFHRIPLIDIFTIHALESEGSILTDVLSTFYLNLKQTPIPNVKVAGVKVVEAKESESQPISEIAREVFKINHFHADPCLLKDKCDELYAKWAVNCLNELADVVLAAKKNSKVLGFVTCKKENLNNKYTYGFIDLIGIAKNYEKRGIGFLLISEALKWFSKYTSSVYIGTQAANLSAVRLYERAGFRLVSSEATLHQWLS